MRNRIRERRRQWHADRVTRLGPQLRALESERHTYDEMWVPLLDDEIHRVQTKIEYSLDFIRRTAPKEG